MHYKQTTKTSMTASVMGALGLATLLIPSSANAVVTAGSASGLGLDVGVNALTTDIIPLSIGLNVGPESVAEVNSPAPDSDSASTASLTASTLLFGSVVDGSGSDDLLTTAAMTDVTGVLATGQAVGTTTTNGLGLNLIPLGLTISSTTIGSSSTTSGQFGSLSSTGVSNFEDLVVTIGAINLLAGIDLLNVAPNTQLIRAGIGLDSDVLANVSIILNEQISTGDSISGSGLTTNALHANITAMDIGLVTGLNGEILIGQSGSSLTAIPEPSSWGAVLVLPAILLLRRHRV